MLQSGSASHGAKKTLAPLQFPGGKVPPSLGAGVALDSSPPLSPSGSPTSSTPVVVVGGSPVAAAAAATASTTVSSVASAAAAPAAAAAAAAAPAAVAASPSVTATSSSAPPAGKEAAAVQGPGQVHKIAPPASPAPPAGSAASAIRSSSNSRAHGAATAKKGASGSSGGYTPGNGNYSSNSNTNSTSNSNNININSSDGSKPTATSPSKQRSSESIGRRRRLSGGGLASALSSAVNTVLSASATSPTPQGQPAEQKVPAITVVAAPKETGTILDAPKPQHAGLEGHRTDPNQRCSISTDADPNAEIRTKVFRMGAPLLRSTIPVALGPPKSSRGKSGRPVKPEADDGGSASDAETADDGGSASDAETVLSLSDIGFEDQGALQVTLDFPC